MPKVILLFFCSLLFIINLYSQNAYYTSIYLASNRNVLKQKSSSFDDFDKYPFSNPPPSIDSLNKLMSDTERMSGTPADIKFLNFSSKQESDFYDGLAKYIAEEFKKGVTIEYMKAFENTIGKVGELQIMFPKTYSLLKNHDPIKLADLGSEWKEIFSDDLKNLMENIVFYIDNPKDKKYSSIDTNKFLFKPTTIDSLKNSVLFNSIYIFLDISNKVINKYKPIELFNYLDIKYYKVDTNKVRKEFGNIIHGLNILQTNLRYEEVGLTQADNVIPTWINFEDFKKLYDKKLDTNGIRYFVALIYQKDPEFWENTGLDTNNVQDFMNYRIMPIFSILTKIQDLSNDKELYDKGYGDFMHVILDIIVEANSIPKKQFLDNDKLMIAQTTIDIYNSIQRKDYHNLISNSFILLEKMFIDSKIISVDIESYVSLISKLTRYGEFMTGIVNAKNSDETKEVIKKFVAPPTSYLEKRSSIFKVTVSSHPGIFTSIDELNRTQGWVSGLTLPIGFEFSFGALSDDINESESLRERVDWKSIKRKSGSSISIFLQLVDLGAALNFRLSNDTTSELPEEITLSQIFSPGVSVNYGLFNNAITVGIGYQLAPKLRKIMKDGFETEERSDRVFMRLSWDLPLFIF